MIVSPDRSQGVDGQMPVAFVLSSDTLRPRRGERLGRGGGAAPGVRAVHDRLLVTG
jgi:hypothetical protein